MDGIIADPLRVVKELYASAGRPADGAALGAAVPRAFAELLKDPSALAQARVRACARPRRARVPWQAGGRTVRAGRAAARARGRGGAGGKKELAIAFARQLTAPAPIARRRCRT